MVLRTREEMRMIREGNIIATARCYEPGCGGTMEGRKGEYKYTECGLNSVTLKGVLVFHCTKCNAIVPDIPAAGVLHRVIAMKLLIKETLLTGSELRFLRKLCGYSVTEFSEIMGSPNKSVIYRWETQSTHGKDTDRIVRLLVTGKLIRELTGTPDPILHNVNAAQLLLDIEQNLKLIQPRRVDEEYEISPEEIARFRGVPETEPAIQELAVQ